MRKVLNNSLTDHVVIKFNVEVVGLYKLPSSTVNKEKVMYHITEMERLTRADDIYSVIRGHNELIIKKMSEFQERDSGWTLVELKWLDLNINKASPIPGSAFIKTPKELAAKKACLNIKNNDDFCFKWCIIAAFFEGDGLHLNRPNKYKIQNISDNIIRLVCGKILNFTGMQFPTEIREVAIFEKKNSDISVNVFGYDRKSKDVIGPFYITKEEKTNHINLLLLESECGEKFHYILVKNLSR